MRVLQINAVYEFGSTGRNVAEIHRYLTERGEDSYVAYGEKKRTQSDRILYIGNVFDHKLHAFLSRLTGKQGYFSKHATKKLCKRLDSIQPDIVHLHNLHANFIHLPTLFRYLTDKKIATVLTLHDCWWFTGKCCHFELAGCDRWKSLCENCPQKRNNNPSLFFDFSKKMHMDRKRWFSQLDFGFIGVSDWITECGRVSCLSGAKKSERIYNWIDPAVFKPSDSTAVREKYGLGAHRVILAVSQGWCEAKGFSDILEIARHFKGDKLLLVGSVPDKKILPRNVITVDYVDSAQEMAALYGAADVFVNPSRMETFGKVTAEAMSCGTPAVVYDNTGCRELVPEGCGFVAENRNISDMIAKIEAVLAAKKASFSECCIKHARRNFDGDTNMEKYRLFYVEMVNRFGKKK